MSKPILEEIKEELEILKDAEAKKVYEAIENKQFPPIPMTPVTVAKTINKVISEHEPTDEELQIFASQRELSPEEQKFVAEYSKED